ncbi:MAG: DUF4270 domain-containing protein [Prevotella sp.]|nr:DUF4270 domain-containing protein [Bacteroides sp.]MCM1366359.1 DUF4270 domain-containing protein [Prevotella sp.]MCM1436283.1 DUF4270 domain-containing protein [Prevotella sp.]
MKIKYLLYLALTLVVTSLYSCDDDVSNIGNSLAQDTLLIYSDSLTLEVPSKSIEASIFDSRTDNHLLGRLSSSEYGDLACSFVAQLMAASSMNVPDSIDVNRVDSVKLIFSMPRGQFIGDSLAPQQLTVYELEKQLPSDIESNFNPNGYFSTASKLGQKTYTLSEITATDTVTINRSNIRFGIDLSVELGKKMFNQYRQDPSVFAWPSSFTKFFPGIYVTRTFGSGCVANVSKVEFMLYYHYLYDKAIVKDGQTTYKQTHLRDSIALFATAPEVLSANCVTFSPAETLKNRVAKGETILVAPGGYNAQITFPTKSIIGKFIDPINAIYVVSGLKFTIPVSQISNNLGIEPPPYLLMVKTSELDTYFSQNKVPDNVSSFYARYSQDDACYIFNDMRSFILPYIENGNLNPDDTEFTIIPVDIESQSYTDTNGNQTTLVTRCAPYQDKPVMVKLDTSSSQIIFTYSVQQLK